MDKTERESRILRERRLELGLSQTEVALNAGLYSCFILRQYDVRLSWIPFIIFPEPKTIAMKEASNDDLRFSILAPNMRHIPTAYFFTMIISHFSFYLSMMQGVQRWL